MFYKANEKMVIDVSDMTIEEILSDTELAKMYSSISVRIFDFVDVAYKSMRDFEVEITNLSELVGSQSQDFDSIQKFKRNLCMVIARTHNQVITNMCFAIEAITNYIASTIHPIIKYDFSNYNNDSRLNLKIESVIFGGSKVSPKNKVLMLFGFYFNSFNFHLNEKTNIKIPNFEIKVTRPYPIFNKDNLEDLEKNTDITITTKGPSKIEDEIALSEILEFVENLFSLRNSIAHPMPFQLGNFLNFVSILNQEPFLKKTKLNHFIAFIKSNEMLSFSDQIELAELISYSNIMKKILEEILDYSFFTLELIRSTYIFPFDCEDIYQEGSITFIKKYIDCNTTSIDLDPLSLDDYCKKIIEKEFNIKELSKSKKKWPDISFLAYSNRQQSN